MTDDIPLLRIRGLSSAHGGPFDLDLADGECVAIMGKSGAGKSLLMRLIADLDPGTGSVMLNGRSRSAWSGPAWRRQVVYQPAEPAWWAPRAADHFAPKALERAQALLPSLDLAAQTMETDVARLSTGERQRMALIRSLSLDPMVLLLDEPTAALDAESTLAVESLLRARMAQGMAIVWVTHSGEQAARMGHRTLLLSNRSLALP